MAFPSWLPLLLGLLSAVGPLSTDMYLPAFPAIEAALGGRAQVTLATWFGRRSAARPTNLRVADHPEDPARSLFVAQVVLRRLERAFARLRPDGIARSMIFVA